MNDDTRSNLDIYHDLMRDTKVDRRRERNRARIEREEKENLLSAMKRAATDGTRLVDVRAKENSLPSMPAQAPASKPPPFRRKNLHNVAVRRDIEVSGLTLVPGILKSVRKLRSPLMRVFLRMANDCSDEEIGRSLGLAAASVKTYRAELSNEFNLHGLKHAVRNEALIEASRQYLALHPELARSGPGKSG